MFNPTSATYTYSQKDGLQLRVRVDGKDTLIPAPFKPYFFVKQSYERVVSYYARRKGINIHIEQTELKTLDGHIVSKVEVEQPRHVSLLRDSMTIETYEADIPYVRRVMIDQDWRTSLHYNKLYYDIEVKDGKIVCIGVSNHKGHVELLKGDEYDILTQFSKIVEGYDMTIGYNSMNYDYPVLSERYKVNKMTIPDEMIRWYDLLPTLQFIHQRKLPSYSLDWVGKNLVGIERVHTDKQFSQLTPQEIYERCMRDVEITVELDRKFSISDIDIMRAHISYIFPDETYLITRSIDTLLLKKARMLGYVLPNKPNSNNVQRHSGAFVLQPPKPFHIYRNVLFLDCVSLYPNIMINFKISPDNEKRLYPTLLTELLNERLRYKQLYKDTNDKKYDLLQYVYKILLNAVYGAVNSQGSRIQRVDLGDEVARRGREIVTSLIKFYSDIGFNVIYADTDSIVLTDIDRDVEVFNMLAEAGSKHIRQTFNVDIQVEPKKFFDRLYFTKRADDSIASKKKYVGYVIWTNDRGFIEPTLDVVGIEIVRSDFPTIAQRLQQCLIEGYLNGKSKHELYNILNDFKIALMKGLITHEELAFSRSITKNKYKTTLPHLRAVRKLQERGINVSIGDKIRFVYTKLGVLPLELCDNTPIDEKFYIDLLERIAERTVGVTFKEGLYRWF